MATSYLFFASSNHGMSQDDLLAELKKVYANNSDYNADICEHPIAQMWQWTLPFAYEKAIRASLNMYRAEEIIRLYFDPLYFASSCGLPTAVTKEEVEKQEEAVRHWLVEGLPWSGPAAKALPNEIKERIFNGAVYLEAAKDSLKDTSMRVWNLMMWAEIEARRLANRPEVLAHLEQVLRSKKVSSDICIHNLIKTHCPICPSHN
uniref:Uncharacterized protein n=1 Tax=viral metagenome TaxID=1070528 RepID=A0A6C0KA06_9ZZZZ